MAKVIEQAQIATQASINQLQDVTQIAFFDANGAPLSVGNVPASTSTAGVVKQAPAQVNSVAADVATLVTDFNALLTKLRASGVLHV